MEEEVRFTPADIFASRPPRGVGRTSEIAGNVQKKRVHPTPCPVLGQPDWPMAWNALAETFQLSIAPMVTL